MAEVYPSDNELLNILNDEATGIEYIATGQAPYYLQFRKMLYRLIQAFSRANQLRVYNAGGLDIGVRAGAFWLGTEETTYSGCDGVTLADNKEEICIYLDASSSLVTTAYNGFPDMAVTPHIRLAKVTTCDGDIESITDCRGGYGYVMPYPAGGIRKTIEAHDQNDELAYQESGSIHTNATAETTVTLLLPGSAPAGTVFDFVVAAPQIFCIDPGEAAIIDSSGQTAGKYKYGNTIGAVMSLAADAQGNWVTIGKTGVWSEEA